MKNIPVDKMEGYFERAPIHMKGGAMPMNKERAQGSFTPDPWIATNKTASKTWEVWAGSNPIAGKDITMDPKDARFIASAPELYELAVHMLVDLQNGRVSYGDENEQAINQIKEVLAKAEGRP